MKYSAVPWVAIQRNAARTVPYRTVQDRTGPGLVSRAVGGRQVGYTHQLKLTLPTKTLRPRWGGGGALPGIKCNIPSPTSTEVMLPYMFGGVLALCSVQHCGVPYRTVPYRAVLYCTSLVLRRRRRRRRTVSTLFIRSILQVWLVWSQLSVSGWGKGEPVEPQPPASQT